MSVCGITLKPAKGQRDVTPVQIQDEAKRLQELLSKPDADPQEVLTKHNATLVSASLQCWNDLAYPELQRMNLNIPSELLTKDVSDPVRLPAGYGIFKVTKRTTGRPTLEQAPLHIEAMWEQDWLGKRLRREREAVMSQVEFTPAFEQALAAATPAPTPTPEATPMAETTPAPDVTPAAKQE